MARAGTVPNGIALPAPRDDHEKSLTERVDDDVEGPPIIVAVSNYRDREGGALRRRAAGRSSLGPMITLRLLRLGSPTRARQ